MIKKLRFMINNIYLCRKTGKIMQKENIVAEVGEKKNPFLPAGGKGSEKYKRSAENQSSISLSSSLER